MCLCCNPLLKRLILLAIPCDLILQHMKDKSTHLLLLFYHKMFSFLAFPTSVPTLDSSITIATLDKTHTKHKETLNMLLTKYAETSPKACTLHQFVKPNMIIVSVCNLFVATCDHWGVIPIPFLLNDLCYSCRATYYPLLEMLLDTKKKVIF
jgi:hypothetical protein